MCHLCPHFCYCRCQITSASIALRFDSGAFLRMRNKSKAEKQLLKVRIAKTIHVLNVLNTV